MNPTSVSPPTAAAPVRKRRWWLRGALAALALAIAVPLALHTYSELGTQGAWADAENEASRDDPRWRLLEMEADRPQLADADNSALYTMAVLRKGGNYRISNLPRYDAIFPHVILKDFPDPDKLPANVQLNGQQVALIRTEFAKLPGHVEALRKLKDMPEGRFPLTFNDDWITTLIPNRQDTREIVDWLKHDAWLLAQEGDCDAAIESCQAIINTGRTVKDEPFIMASYVRLHAQHVALDTLERVLAQGEAAEERLRALQAMLEKEIRQDSFVLALRGERAGLHYLFENLRTGKVKPDIITRRIPDEPISNKLTGWVSRTVPSTVFNQFPDTLRHLNRTVAAAKLPLHERDLILWELEIEVRQSGNLVTRLLAPPTSMFESRDRRVQIYLRSMVVALACERFRLKDEERRWPATLDDLVKAKLLDAVPADPIDGQPLRYRQTKEGVFIYSIGFDREHHPQNINCELGIRLWNPELRRRPPLPPVVFPVGP